MWSRSVLFPAKSARNEHDIAVMDGLDGRLYLMGATGCRFPSSRFPVPKFPVAGCRLPVAGSRVPRSPLPVPRVPGIILPLALSPDDC
jgi:hypothetical protein